MTAQNLANDMYLTNTISYKIFHIFLSTVYSAFWFKKAEQGQYSKVQGTNQDQKSV